MSDSNETREGNRMSPDMFIPPDGLELKTDVYAKERNRDYALRSVIFALHKQKHPVPEMHNSTAHDLVLWQDYALDRFKSDVVFRNDVMWVFNEMVTWFRKDQPR